MIMKEYLKRAANDKMSEGKNKGLEEYNDVIKALEKEILMSIDKWLKKNKTSTGVGVSSAIKNVVKSELKDMLK